MAFTWIVTKSQPHADSLVIQLRRQGFCALAIPASNIGGATGPTCGASAPLARHCCSSPAAPRRRASMFRKASWSPPLHRPRPQRSKHAAYASALPRTAACVSSRRQYSIRRRFRTGADVFYPTSDAALRQPEHLAAVATLSQRLRVHTQAVYSTVAPDNLAQELAALRASGAPAGAPLGYCFWSPSAIENFAGARGFELPPGPVVLIGGSTMRCWRESAPPDWRRAYKHDAETPLEWSLRFLERGAAADGS